MKLVLIRHGKTKGNEKARYVGRTDEPLSEDGKRALQDLKYHDSYPSPDKVFVSPMLRCTETADILFPFHEKYVTAGLQECDFGDFEYKNYQELNGHPQYQAWIDSGGLIGFPNGESREQFCQRVTTAFNQIVHQLSLDRRDEMVAIVAHGGTIMAILDAYSCPHRDYFDWQVKNGCGYEMELDLEAWINGEKSLSHINIIGI